MRRPVLMGWLLAAGCTLAVTGVMAQQPSLLGTAGGPHPPLTTPPQGTEMLFRGDLLAGIGIGCSNRAGTSGGPNDFAVGVTAAFPPPFYITSVAYNLFTQISPTITALSFVAWLDSAGAPGAELGRQAGLPFPVGNSTAAITPQIAVTASPAFFFGLDQPQTNVGIRVGLDTSTTGGATSFIRAPSCGATTFFSVTALGFLGNWVMSAVVDDVIPVELTAFEVD